MQNNKALRKLLISLLSVLIGLLVGSIILFATGNNPLVVMTGIIKGTFSNSYKTGEWIVYMTPLILTGLSIGFAMRTGLFNIGAEGQFIVGTIAALITANTLPASTPAFLIATLSLLAAAGFGALYAGIVGLIKAKFGVHEVVISIMFNYIALEVSNALLNTMTSTPGTAIAYNTNASISFPQLAQLFTFQSAVPRMNYGIVIALVCVVLYWFVFEKTIFGFEIKAVGFNPFAAKSAGINTNQKIVTTMLIAGAFAGLAGGIYLLGMPGGISPASSFRNYGFDGIAIALLGQLQPVGILFSSMLFSMLRGGVKEMTTVPSEIIDIIIGIVILCSSIGMIFEEKIGNFFTKSAKEGDE